MDAYLFGLDGDAPQPLAGLVVVFMTDTPEVWQLLAGGTVTMIPHSFMQSEADPLRAELGMLMEGTHVRGGVGLLPQLLSDAAVVGTRTAIFRGKKTFTMLARSELSL